jgi:hypothetical protein
MNNVTFGFPIFSPLQVRLKWPLPGYLIASEKSSRFPAAGCALPPPDAYGLPRRPEL